MPKTIFYFLICILIIWTFALASNVLAETTCGPPLPVGGKAGICCQHGCQTDTLEDVDTDCASGYACCAIASDPSTVCKSAPASSPSPAPPATAEACPSDNEKSSSGTCGLDSGVKSTDGWCCRDTSASGWNDADWECKSKYCSGPYSASKWKCCKAKSGGSGDTGGTGGGTTGGSGGGSVSLADLSPVGDVSVPEIIGKFLNAVLGVIGAIALLMFIYGGISMLISAGNQEKIKKGKDVITWSIIGIAVILGSYVLVDFLITGLGGEGGGTGVPDSGTSGGSTTQDACTQWGGTCTPLTACQGKTGSDLSSCITATATAENKECVQNKCPGQDAHVVCCKQKSGSSPSPGTSPSPATSPSPPAPLTRPSSCGSNGWTCTDLRPCDSSCAGKTGADLSACCASHPPAGTTCYDALCPSDAHGVVCCKTNP